MISNNKIRSDSPIPMGENNHSETLIEKQKILTQKYETRVFSLLRRPSNMRSGSYLFRKTTSVLVSSLAGWKKSFRKPLTLSKFMFPQTMINWRWGLTWNSKMDWMAAAGWTFKKLKEKLYISIPKFAWSSPRVVIKIAFWSQHWVFRAWSKFKILYVVLMLQENWSSNNLKWGCWSGSFQEHQ